ncbi:hypothetical protein J5N97_009173 [Dioscorea zingiberensis]|uniref:PNPLA domain-containing protein n=1 Tax=Dioscorea zingiberensis TaxID=325984 RepID=A0A9D5CYT5_9LILI|nr:hypothetical protein J5N97_009173 [Dioscorea zingiberensis]
MRPDLLRNLGNMCNLSFTRAGFQVPKLIKEYIDEVSTQLKLVCILNQRSCSWKRSLLSCMRRRHAFGRTALLLSGGASLGAFHVGVVKHWLSISFLPRIIAGSSVGSIMCSIVATRTSWHSLQFFDHMGGIFTVVRRVVTHGAVVHDIRQLQRFAVAASCAFPGLFEAQELMAKDRFGRNCSALIHLLLQTQVRRPDLLCGAGEMGSLERTAHDAVERILAHLTEMEVKHRFNQVLELGFPLGGIAKLFAKIGKVMSQWSCQLSTFGKLGNLKVSYRNLNSTGIGLGKMKTITHQHTPASTEVQMTGNANSIVPTPERSPDNIDSGSESACIH